MRGRARECRRTPRTRPLAGLLFSLLPGMLPGGVSLPAVAGEEWATTLTKAQALLADGQAATAWALLEPLELDAAGSPDFDYWYGLAALDAGRPADAIPAFERVLAGEPGFAGARMELARARFETGDLPAAEAQFRFLLTESPPPATRAVIDRYLQAIEQDPLPATGRSRFVPYAELGAGWDSNANASTGSDTFGIFVLNPDNVETSSSFLELAGGFRHGLAVEPGGTLISSARASYRLNPDADFVDQLLLSLGAAGQKSWGESRASLGASGYYSWLDGSQHELGAGMDLGLARQFGPGWELAATGRAGVVRYQQDELEVLDVNRFLGALALTRAGIGTREGRAGIAALFGTDREEEDDSPYGNDRLGARAFGGWRLGPTSSLYLEAAYLETDFDDTPGFTSDGFTYADREDEQWSVAISTEYREWPAAGYSLVPTLRYTTTDSTVSLFEYDRFEIGVYLRRSGR